MLNSPQQQAVKFTTGPLAIMAGPGTGKTKTLVAKIEYLIQQKLARPTQILALTFTNKAAAEIKERLNLLNAEDENYPFIGTFHGFCLHLLVTHTQQSVKLIAEAERKKIIHQLLKNNFSQSDLAEFSWHEISLKLSQLKLSLSLKDQNQSNFQQQLSQLLDQYQLQLKAEQLIDYDDLLVNTVELLNQQPSLAEKIGLKYQYILVDEFQDTHLIQYQIIKLITAKIEQPNITVIGDPLQSIYGFRGAAGDIFHQFQQDFPTAQTLTLTINYRSRPQIIKLSHSLFPQSQLLIANNLETADINFVTTLNEQSESQWIINHIQQQLGGLNLNQASDFHHQGQQLSFKDFAVIYRTHHLARNLENALEKSGLPYQTIGSLSVFEKKEIGFLIDTLSFLFNHNDLNLEKLQTHSLATPSLINALKSLPNQINNLNPRQLIEQILQLSHLDEVIKQSSTKQRDLQTFHQYLQQFSGSNWLPTCVEYLQNLSVHDYYDERADRLTLLTMHAAKGLEFSQVFLIGFEKDLIPHQKRLSNEEVTEEKRLLYVALTRAKDFLTVINCLERFHQTNRTISPFFKEFDSQDFTVQIDPAIKKIQKYRQKTRDQKRQMSLF
jgi:superfamily I DNA/RNA helicase